MAQNKTMTAYLIDVNNGVNKTVNITPELREFYELLECTTIDIAVRGIGGKAYNIVVDDEGLLKQGARVSAMTALKPMLYGNLLVFAVDRKTGDLAQLSTYDISNIEAHLVPSAGMGDKGNLEFWKVIMLD